MSDSAESSEERSLQRAQQVDALCDEFETQCIVGARPSIDAFLSRINDSDKQTLLIELIALEMHYRRRQGESVVLSEYQSRFPGLSVSSLEETIPLRKTGPSQAVLPSEELATIDSRDGIDAREQSTTVKYFGDYELLNVIARGGMGIVYRARQVSLGRIVALKMILSGDFASKEEVERFYSEAKAAALLDHPGIVPIFEVGEHDGKHFFSMAFVDGSSLAFKLNEGPLEPVRAAEILLEVARAVQYAHEQGVIHRDLKPSNILLDQQGRPRVTDFGLAKRLTESSGLTVSGQILGTPSYMPPEQAAGRVNTIGPASDVYALGAVLYSLLTGRPPFQAASSLDTLRQVIYQDPVTPRQLNPSIPLDLQTITIKCLEKSLPRRYPTAQVLAEELQRFLTGIPIQARPVSRLEKLIRWCKRQPAVASLSAFAVFLLASLLVGFSWAYFREAGYRTVVQAAFDNEKKAKDAALEASQKADKAARLADEARQEKERQAEIASRERDRAKTSEETMRRSLYISDMGRAQEAIDTSHYARATTLLERHRPTSDQQSDLRSLDWYLLHHKVVRPKAAWRFKKPVEVMALSPDQTQVAVGCEGGRAYVVDIASGKVGDNRPFFLEEQHWATLGFRHDGMLVGQGQLGSIKFWNVADGTTLAHKPHHGSLQINAYRLPAAISDDGNRMLGSDNAGLLALWNLNTLRPQQVPFINEGYHFYAANMPMFFTVDVTSRLQSIQMDTSRATEAGYRDMREYLLDQHVRSLPYGYAPVGQRLAIPTMDTPLELGHPVASMTLPEGMVVVGKSTGELELLKIQELENAQEWAHARPLKKRISSRPIKSVAYIRDLNTIVATDETSCFVLSAQLEPILTIPSSQAPFCKVCTAGKGRVAVGRKDGVVEIWSIFDETKMHELNSGTSDVTGVIVLKDSTSLLLSNSDGSVGLFSMATEQQEFVPSQGLLSDYQFSPSTIFWQSSTKSLAIHHSLGGRLRRFRPGESTMPTQSNVAATHSLLVTMDALSPAIYLEQPHAKRLLGIYAQQLRLLDPETLEVQKNLDITAHEGGDFPVSIFKPIDGGFEHHSVSRDASVLSVASTSNTFSTLSILCADDFPDEKRVALAVGNTNQTRGLELRLLIRELDQKLIQSEMTIDGAQIQKSTFQLMALDDSRILLDGVFLSGDTQYLHTLLYNIPEASLRVIDKRPEAASLRNSDPGATSRIFNCVASHNKIVIQGPNEIRVIDAGSLATTHRLKASPGQQFKFAQMTSEGALCAVIMSSPCDFSWSTWNDATQQWDLSFADRVSRDRALVSNYHWCFDPERFILFHLESPFEAQRWACRTGESLPTVHLPEGKVRQVVANGAASMVAWSESSAPTFISQTPPWSVSWFNGSKSNHELIQSSTHDKRSLYFLPLTPHGNSWLTSQGVKYDMQGTTPDSILSVEGKTAPWSMVDFRDSHLLLSRDTTVLVELKSNAVESWQLSNSPTEHLPRRFVSRGRHTLPWKLPVASTTFNQRPFQLPGSQNSDQPSSLDKLSCISHDGAKLALLADKKIQFSTLPFKDWTTIDPSMIKGDDVTAMAVSAGEASVYVGLEDGDIVELGSDGRSFIRYAKGHLGPVTSLLEMPDGKTLVSGGRDGNLIVWDVVQKEMRMRFAAHGGAVNSLFWNQATEELLSAGEDGIVRKWLAVSNENIDTSLGSQFIAPDPTEVWNEIRFDDDQKAQTNRSLVAEFQKRNIGFQLLSFGMRIYASSDFSAFDQLAIDTVEITPDSNLDGLNWADLQALTELRTVKIHHSQVTSQLLVNLAKLPAICWLQVSGVDLSEISFDAFNDWKNLQTLSLEDCGITDSQLQTIASKFPQLTDLNLASANITDLSAESIGSFAQLRSLTISHTPVTDSITSAINKLRGLEALDLNGTKITSNGIQQLSELRLLRRLAVQGVGVQPENFKELWPRLAVVDVRDTLANEQSLRGLLGYQNLSVIVSPNIFAGSREAEILAQLGPIPSSLEVDSERLEILDALTKLREGGSITALNWPSTQLPLTGSLLQSLPNLRSLTISSDAKPAVHFPPLQKLTGLTKLDLSLSPSLTQEEFALLYEIPNISAVQVRRLDTKMLQKLAGFPNLRSLAYSDGADLTVVAMALPNLNQINCDDAIDAEKLSKVGKRLTQLETLTTSVKLSPALLNALSGLPALKSLRLERALSEKALADIRSALPGVDVSSNVNGK